MPTPLDAECYGKIFGRTHPEAQFVPGGANSEVATDRRGYAYLVGRLTPGATVTRLLDRDDKSASEVAALLPIRTLGRRNIESYLFADDVLERFAESVEADSWQRIKPMVDRALADAIGRGHPADDRKPAAPAIYDVLRRELKLVGVGSTANAFAKDQLVRLITPDSEGYKELEAAIF